MAANMSKDAKEDRKMTPAQLRQDIKSDKKILASKTKAKPKAKK